MGSHKHPHMRPRSQPGWRLAVMSAVLLFVAAAVAFAQPKTGAEPPQRLVLLDVAATNAKGEPVTDLRASEIQIREDGKAHPAAFFHFAGPKRAMLPLVEGESANRPAVTPTLILFDRWNERLTVALSAWSNLGAALQRLESVDSIFIYFLTNHGDLFPVHPVPSADADLRAMVEPTPVQLRGKLDDAVRTLNGFRDVDVEDPFLRINTTFRALYMLGSQMAAIAGRKNLIWVTHGFPVTLMLPEIIDFAPQIRQFSAAATASQIAIYTVDESTQGAADMGSVFRQTLDMFSSLTGGRLYPTDNTPEALSAAITDGRGNYRLAYYSPTHPKDRKEHRIRLESSRKGVRLLTSEGFFGDVAEPDPAALEHSLFSSVPHSPFEASEIGVRVALSPAPSGSATHFAIHIDPADILLEQRDGSYRGQLALLFAFDSHGFLERAAAPVHIDVNLTPDQFSQAQKDGIDASQDVEVSSDAEKIRVIVMDRKLYALGSVTVSPLRPR